MKLDEARRDFLNILLGSMSTLFLESLQIALQLKKPAWNIYTYSIKRLDLNNTILPLVEKKEINTLIIEANVQQFGLFIDSLKNLKIDADFLLLVDNEIGEVHHHSLSNNWKCVLKNSSLERLIEIIEKPDHIKEKKSNRKQLNEQDDKVLHYLLYGYSFESITNLKKISMEQINISLENINEYFNAANYIEAVQKAVNSNYFNTGVIENDY